MESNFLEISVIVCITWAVLYFYFSLLLSILVIRKAEKSLNQAQTVTPQALSVWHPWYHLYKVCGYGAAISGKAPWTLKVVFPEHVLNNFKTSLSIIAKEKPFFVPVFSFVSILTNMTVFLIYLAMILIIFNWSHFSSLIS